MYGFKGPWDAAGKIIKYIIRKFEMDNQTHAETAYACYIITRDYFKTRLSNGMEWGLAVKEGNPALKAKSVWKAFKRFACYVSDDESELKCLAELSTSENPEDGFIIFSNWEDMLNDEDSDMIPGTTSCHYFAARAPDSETGEVEPVAILAEDEHQDLIYCRSCRQVICKSNQDIQKEKERHDLFCIMNPDNQKYALHYQENPCLCRICQNGNQDDAECKFVHIKGNAKTVEMMRRDRLEKQKLFLANEKEQQRQGEEFESICTLVRSIFQAEFPNIVPYPPYMENMVTSNTVKIKVGDHKVIAFLIWKWRKVMGKSNVRWIMKWHSETMADGGHCSRYFLIRLKYTLLQPKLSSIGFRQVCVLMRDRGTKHW